MAGHRSGILSIQTAFFSARYVLQNSAACRVAHSAVWLYLPEARWLPWRYEWDRGEKKTLLDVGDDQAGYFVSPLPGLGAGIPRIASLINPPLLPSLLTFTSGTAEV